MSATRPRAIGMLFPGHGSEVPRMGLELAESDPRAAELLELAGSVASVDARRVLRRGGDRLSDTRALQPLMTAVLLGLVEALGRAGLTPSCALGHSLGEISALASLGGARSERAIELAGVRGRVLGELAARQRGAMLTLPRGDEAALARALAIGRAAIGRAAKEGVEQVDLAVHAAPNRYVLAGPRAALARIVEEIGGSFVATTGAWHCRLMSPARPLFRAALDALTPDDLCAPPGLILNEDGRLLGARGRAVLIDALAGQLDGCVQFCAGMSTLREQGLAELILVGPAKVLRALVRENFGVRELAELEGGRVAGLPRLHVVEGPRDVERVVGRVLA